MKLGNYKGLRARRPDITVKEAEIDKVLKNKQRENSVVYTVDDRPARMGDQAILNFNARCGGKDIPGGQSRSYPLLLGSHTFVKGFEEAVAGHSIGDRFEIRVTFPADYRIADLRQKEVIYHVHLTGLRIPEYQEINDEFARDFSEYETLADWRNAIREELAERHELSAYQKLTRELLDQVIADSSVPVDRDLLQDLAEDLYDDFLYDLEDSNMTLEKYCKRTGKNKRQIRAEKEAEAAQIIRQQSVLHAIANREHLTVTEEELAGEIAAMAAGEGEDPEVFASMLGDEEIEGISDQLQLDKAMEFILEHVCWEE